MSKELEPYEGWGRGGSDASLEGFGRRGSEASLETQLDATQRADLQAEVNSALGRQPTSFIDQTRPTREQHAAKQDKATDLDRERERERLRGFVHALYFC